jgi:hypothetical protein
MNIFNTTNIFERITALAVMAGMILLFLPANAFAQGFNKEINYQGKLNDAGGSTVADGDYNMTFRLYNASSSGTLIRDGVWSVSGGDGPEVSVSNGLFSVRLGRYDSLNSVDFNQDLWLSLEVESDGEMTPRKKLTTVPSAFEAQNAETVGGVASSSLLRSDQSDTQEATSSDTLLSVLQNGAGNVFEAVGSAVGLTVDSDGDVGVGTSTPSTQLEVVGTSTFNGDAIADFTGSNLSVTNGTLDAAADDAVSGSELDNLFSQNGFLERTGTSTYQATSTIDISDDTNLSASGGASLSDDDISVDDVDTLSTGLTSGSIPFSNGTTLSEDNSNLFWDSGNQRLGVGTNNPSERMEVSGSGGTRLLVDDSSGYATLRLSGASGETSAIDFGRGSSNYWGAGIKQQSGNNDFWIYDAPAGDEPRFIIDAANGNVGIGTTSPAETLSVSGNILGTGNLQIGGDTISNFSGSGLTVNSNNLQVDDIDSINTSLATGSVAFSDGSTLTEDNSNLYWDNSNNSLGIGTSSPRTTLEVNGTTTQQDALVFDPGSVMQVPNQSDFVFEEQEGDNVFEFQYSSGIDDYQMKAFSYKARSTSDNWAAFGAEGIGDRTGITFPNDNELGFIAGTNGTERMRIIGHGTNEGNVGIGTSSPTDTLTVAGTSSIQADGTAAFQVQNTSGQNLVEADTANGEFVVRQPGGTAGTDEVQIYHDGAETVFNSENNGFRFNVNGGGRIIMGNTELRPGSTASPDYNLGSSGRQWDNFYLGGNIEDGGDNELLSFTPTSSAVNNLDIANAATGIGPTLSATGDNTNIPLNVNAKGSGNIVFSNSQKLVELSAGFGLPGDSPEGIVEAAQYRTALGGTAVPYGDIGGSTGMSFDGSDLTFYTNSSEQARIDSNGNFAIGTTSPTDTLSVSGTSNVTGTTTLATNGGRVGVGTANPDARFAVTGSPASSPVPDQKYLSSINAQSQSTAEDTTAQVVRNTVSPTGATDRVYVGNASLASTRSRDTANATLMGTESGVAGADADIGTAIGSRQQIAASTISGSGSTINNAFGTQVLMVIENSAGVAIDNTPAQGPGNNNTSLLLGTTKIPSGDYALYSESQTPSYFGGNVGIGTTSPASKLAVSGTTTADAISVNGDAISDFTGNNLSVGSDGVLDASGGSGSPGGSDGQLQYNNGGSFGGLSGFVLDDTNNRLGVGTSSPTSKLAVSGTTTIRGPLVAGSGSLGASADDTNVSLGFKTVANGGDGAAAIGNNSSAIGVGSIALGDQATANNANSAFALGDSVTSTGGSGSIAMGQSIDVSGAGSVGIGLDGTSNDVTDANTMSIMGGQVGIGTTSPASKLVVSGTTTADAVSVSGDEISDFTGNNLTVGSDGKLDAASGSGSPGGSDGQIQYNNGGSFGGLSGFVLDDTNNRLGIGTTSPVSKLAVSGTTTLSGAVESGTGDVGSFGDNTSVALGKDVTVNGSNGVVALGNGAEASGYYGATAIGYNATAQGDYTVAIGDGVNTTLSAVDGAMALGYATEVDAGKGAMAIGNGITVSGDSSIGFGLNDQSGTTVSDANTMSIMGGQVGIGTTSPASKLAVSGTTTADAVSVSGDEISDFTGNNLSVGSDGVLDASGGSGPGIWDLTSGVVSNTGSNSDETSDDFVFGSDQLNDDGNSDHDSRMFFDKSSAAFRAGEVAYQDWDSSNVGNYSAAFGISTRASGLGSFAAGDDTTASGDQAVALGNLGSASGKASFSAGSDAYASGDYSIALGQKIEAQGSNSFAVALSNTGSIETVSANDAAFVGGQVGIGTTSPVSKLAVSGTTTADGNLNVTDKNRYQYAGSDFAFASTTQDATAVGIDAGANNIARDSSLFGYQAGQSNSSTFVTAIGSKAARNNTRGPLTAIGYRAAESNSGFDTTAIGYDTAKENSGDNTTAIGHQAAETNSGSFVTANGRNAAQNNGGFFVTAIGNKAGQDNTGSSLTANGSFAAENNTGSDVTANGYLAAQDNTGSSLTANGSFAAENNTKDGVTAFGAQAVRGDGITASNMGARVTGIGTEALRDNTGTSTTALGYNAGGSNTGDNSVLIGRGAGENNSTDDQFILQQANVNATPLIQGDFATGNVGIGTSSPVSTANGSTTLAVNGNFFVDGDGVGTSTITDNLRVEKNLAVGTSSLMLDNNSITNTTGTLALQPNGLNNVSIGTTSASDQLTVAGTTSFSGPISLATDSGRVGIGTSSPIAALQVDPDASDLPRFSDGGLTIDTFATFGSNHDTLEDAPVLVGSDRNNNPVIRFSPSIGTDGYVGWLPGGDGVFMGTDGNKPTVLRTNEKARLYAAGNGNIGVGTTSPTNLLDVEGAAAIGANYSGDQTAPSNGLLVEGNVGLGKTNPGEALALGNNQNIQMNGKGAIQFRSTGSKIYESSGLVIEGDAGGDRPIRFLTGGTERMRVEKGTGNVGIGTTSPSTRLAVSGDVTLENIRPKENYFSIGRNATTSGCANNVAIGEDALIGGSGDCNRSVAIGSQASTTWRSVAVGADTRAVAGGVAVGNESRAANTGSIAVGRKSYSNFGSAFGFEAFTSNIGALALGNFTDAGAADSVVLGSGAGGSNKLTNNTSQSLIAGFGTTTPFLYVDNTSMGLGTTSPSSELSVDGDVQATGLLDVDGTGTSTVESDIDIDGSIVPRTDDTYTLGTPSKQWKDVYIGPGSLYVNGQKVLQESSSDIVVSADQDQTLQLETSGTGDITMNPSGSGKVLMKSDVELSSSFSFDTSDSSAVSFPNGIVADNLKMSGNVLSASNTNGNIEIAPDGTGNAYVSSGRFGVGTTAPASTLDVAGTTTADAVSVNGDTISDFTGSNLTVGSDGKLDASGGGGSPGGSDGQVQFNSSGSFAGSSNFFWDDTNNRLGIGTSSPSS